MERFFQKAKHEIVETLYEKDAIKWNLKKRFKLKSGALSPMFCNAGVLENTLETRSTVASALVFWLGYNYPDVEAIVGVASGGISWATSLANSKGLPLFRAHAKRKKHGLYNQIDGELPFDGVKVLVIDDVITSGKSVLNIVKALRKGVNGKKAEVLAVCTIFDWDFVSANKRFKRAGVPKHHITSFQEVLSYGTEKNLLPEGALKQVEKFIQEQNSAKRTGVSKRNTTRSKKS